ncbi:MAG: type II toxin-antitoxin system HicA family toxin [Chloroflexi bacterium]|nr:type II toxin-antitoxin system HicA family toxin [Chloroflexota bacterium]
MAPQVRAREVIRALERAEWYVDRQRGSHVILRRLHGPGQVVVPVHGGRTLRSATLHFILKQANLTEEQLRELL